MAAIGLTDSQIIERMERIVRWGPWAAQHRLRHPLLHHDRDPAFHVISGLIALAVIYGMVRNGRFGKGNYLEGEGSVKYWHFVEVAWVFIYPVLYLVN